MGNGNTKLGRKKMKRKRAWLLYPLIILAVVLCAVPAFADTPTSIPSIPHAFYGTVTIDGSDASVGTVVMAKVGGVQCGSITTTVAGQYGGSGAFDEKLTVTGEIATGATISFFVNGVDTTQTYAFIPGGVTELNLTAVSGEDTTPPTVSSVSPVADATGVAVGTTVSVTFSEAMSTATITTSSFTLDSVAGSVSYDSGTYTATFTPSANLAENTTYTATLSTAITDVAGNPLAAYSWSFTTTPEEDTTPPTVSSKSPAADAVAVVVGTTVSVTFSEAMASATITTSSFTLDSVAGSVSYNSGTYTATFTPGADLSESTTYTATLSTAITDVAGNPLASAYSWSFTTTKPGDANGDGVVDALDITKVERIIVGLDASTPGADANGDGNVNALDITKVERIIAGLD
jgi:hypothetical protein